MPDHARAKTVTATVATIVMAVLLGFFITSEYVRARGINYLETGNQIQRHKAVLAGHAGNPWQYRVLAPYLVDPLIPFFSKLDVHFPTALAFIVFRFFLDTFIILLAVKYYHKMGLPMSWACLGAALLAWGMSYSHYDSDLQFSTFFDIIFYLLAGLCILHGKYFWIVPITLFAALNRETSGLIPFLLLCATIPAMPGRSLSRMLPIFLGSVLIFLAVFIGLRMIYGRQPLNLPYGHHPGLDMLQYNLFRAITWRQLVATLSIIPILALVGYRRWPHQLKMFFWIIVPVWSVVHAFGAVMAETRIFLVPQAMVFIPGALWSLKNSSTHPP